MNKKFFVSTTLKAIAIAFMLLLPVLKPTAVLAQGHGNTSFGTDFWMGFMPDYTIPADNIRIYLCSGTANHVVVSIYGGGNGGPSQTMTFNLSPGQAQTVTLPVGKAETRINETPAYRAVHVVASNPMACYGFSNQYATSDGYLCLPTPVLGTEYYTQNYYDDWYYSPSEPLAGEFLIVAPFKNTHVQITTKSDTRLDLLGKVISHLAGSTWEVDLDQGQTYLVQSPGLDKSNDISGSYITSDQPIVLISGHQRCSIPNDDPTYNSKDMLAEMIPSVDKWGTQYFDMPMEGRTKCGDYVRVMSAEDNNNIQVNGGTSYYLNKGEYAEENFVLVPTVYTSISVPPKKFITMQYAYTQNINGDPGVSDPFMITMTPQEQFQKLLIFRTPKNPGSNGDYTHYATFVGEADSLLKIKLNGKTLGSWGAVAPQTFLGTSNPVMGATRLQLSAGEVTYTASSGAPFGVYLYGFTYVDGYGWPAGMAMNIPSKDTLPPIQVGTQSCGDYSVTVTEPRHEPAYSFEDTKIASISMITDSLDPRWAKPSYNYTFTPNPSFQVGDSITSFTLNVINLKQDAYAAVYAVDRAGNDSVYQYTYIAPKYTLSPAPIYDYGNVTVSNDSCKTITITNKQTVGTLNFSGLRIQNSAKGGTFTYTPSTIPPIGPGQSTQIKICYLPTDTGILSTDTINFETGLSATATCIPDTLAVQGIGVTPLILASDLNYGEVDTGQTSCKGLKITNVGKATLTITKQDLLNTADFSVDPNQAFPIVILPGQSVTITYCFHPKTPGLYSTNAIFGTENPLKFAHSIKDTSVLIGESFTKGARLTSYEEGYAASCGQTPLILDTIYNPLQQATTINSAKITGPDASSFSIVGYTPNRPYPFTLDTGLANAFVYTIKFDPTVNGMLAPTRHAFLRIADASNDTLVASLTADSKAPALKVAPGSTAVNLGSTLITQTLTGTFTVSDTGNDVLNIGSIIPTGPNASYYTSITPPGPYTLQPGQSQVETVTFTAGDTAGIYNTTYDVNPAGNTCALLGVQLVTASVGKTGYVPLGADYGPVFTCKTKDLSTASFSNKSSSESATITSIDIVNVNGWTNATDFQLVPPFTASIPVPAQTTINVPIRFSPTATGPRAAGLVFTYTTPSGTSYDTVELQGIGNNVQETVGAGNATAVANYSGHANDPISVPIVLSTPFQTAQTSEVFGYDFKVSWPRDAFQINSNVTQANGIPVVEVGSPVIDPATQIETREYRGLSTKALTTETNLATLTGTVMLDTVGLTAIQPVGVTFLDVNQQPICYVASTTVNGTFAYQSGCGDQTIKNVLKGDQLALAISGIEPNPVHTVATIKYDVNQLSANVTVSIFDALGNEVKRLVDNAPTLRGTYSAVFDGHGVASGSYFVRLTDGTNTVSREIVLTK